VPEFDRNRVLAGVYPGQTRPGDTCCQAGHPTGCQRSARRHRRLAWAAAWASRLGPGGSRWSCRVGSPSARTRRALPGRGPYYVPASSPRASSWP